MTDMSTRGDTAAALSSLRPGAEWSMQGDALVWHDQVQAQPSPEEIAAERARLERRHAVPTIDVVQRLSSSGLLATANAALEQNIELKARFYTVGFIYSDSEEAREFLTAIGADADAILAP